MSSKKYVKIFVYTVISCISLLWGLAWIVPESSYMDREYAGWQSKKEYVREIGEREEILFLGDSRMLAAVNPTILSKPGFNLAINGANPVEMYFTLKNYIENHPKPKAVFVGFAPEHMASLDAYKRRNFHFHYFTYEEAMESQRQIFESDHYSKEQQNKELIDDWHYFLRLPTRYGNVIIKSKFKRGAEYKKRYHETMANLGHSVIARGNQNNEPNWEARQKNLQILGSNDFYLRKIIALCQEYNVPVNILQLPVNPGSGQAIKESGYREAYADYMRKIADEFQVAVELYAPLYPEDCFGDPSHLNVRGTEVYTKELEQKYSVFH